MCTPNCRLAAHCRTKGYFEECKKDRPTALVPRPPPSLSDDQFLPPLQGNRGTRSNETVSQPAVSPPPPPPRVPVAPALRPSPPPPPPPPPPPSSPSSPSLLP